MNRENTRGWVFAIATMIAAAGCGVSEPLMKAEASDDGDSASVVALEISLPDESGRFHHGIGVVSANAADQLEWLLEGATAVTATASATRPVHGLSYEERRLAALGAVSAAASNEGSVLLALVFDEDEVVGWHGTMKSAQGALQRSALGGRHTEGFSVNPNGLTTVAKDQVAFSAAFFCGSATANGCRAALSLAESDVRFNDYLPPPLGSQIATTLHVSSTAPCYSWGTQTVFGGSWFYVSSTQTTSGNITVNNMLFCM